MSACESLWKLECQIEKASSSVLKVIFCCILKCKVRTSINEHLIHYSECKAKDITVHALLSGFSLVLDRAKSEGEITCRVEKG